MEWFNGHTHSDYSNIRLLDSTNKISTIIDTSIKLGCKGVAITDHECLSGHIVALNHLKKLKKKAASTLEKNPNDEYAQAVENFSLVLGNEIYLTREGLNKNNYIKGQDKYWHLILLAKDEIGHRQLRDLSSRAWKRSYRQFLERVPTYPSDIEEIIGKEPGHIICTTACLGSQFAHLVMNAKKDLTSMIALNSFVKWCKNNFGKDFFIELQPSETLDQINYNKEAILYAQKNNLPLTITTDAHYSEKSSRPIHKAFLNANDGEREVDSFYASTYLMSWDEVIDFFPYVDTETMEKIRQNTLTIANSCKSYTLDSRQTIPRVPYSKEMFDIGTIDIRDYANYPYINKFFISEYEDDRVFIIKVLNSLINYSKGKDKNWVQARVDRLEKECEEIWEVSQVIEERLSAYLITMTYIIDIAWNKTKTIVGPGRGSSYTMLSCFLLGIIQEDPLNSPINLAYWRFLHRERPELADIDTDFQATKKDQLIEDVSNFFESFGGHAVRIATFGTETSKAAIQTACRGLNVDSEIATYLSSLVPVDRGQPRTLSQVFYGDEEKDLDPVQIFIQEIEKYPDVWEVAQNIEGLISRRGIHACGILITNEDFTVHNAYMKAPNGVLCSQYDLHDSEQIGCIKYDFLVTDALDRIAVALKLLVDYGVIEWKGSLKETYDAYLSPQKIDYESEKMWNLAAEGKIISLFQFETPIGASAIKQIKPTTLLELGQANSLMRLMPEGRKETPLEEFIKFKNNIQYFKDEIDELAAPAREKQALLNHLLPLKGVADTQESVMLLSMDPALTNFTVGEANKLRKTIAKKLTRDIDSMKAFFYKKGADNNCSIATLDYLWNTQFARQMGYSFSSPHVMAYSTIAVQEMNLCYHYPTIFWNCACLIVDSAGIDEEDDWDFEEDEDEEVAEDSNDSSAEGLIGDLIQTKKKVRTVNYGKISIAINKMRTRGINVTLPDINRSDFTFTPDVDNNRVLFGMKGISKINDTIAKTIIQNRPYASFEDFQSKVKLGKIPTLNLIKSGAFDGIVTDRRSLMMNYLESVAETKNKLTLQNMAMLIRYGLIPLEFDFQRKIFNYNKYLKTLKTGELIELDEVSLPFYCENFDSDKLIIKDNKTFIKADVWKKIYDKQLVSFKDFLKNNNEMLLKLNNVLIQELVDKYGSGTISKWEMDSVNFYASGHELENVSLLEYEARNFFEQPENPYVARTFLSNDGRQIPMFDLFRIIGTVIDKNKLKNTVTLLTKDGVVEVRLFRAQFSKYDKQVAEKQPDGTKKIVEKSWFARGNILMFTGFRREDVFIPKVYKKSAYKYPIQLVEKITPENRLVFREMRDE